MKIMQFSVFVLITAVLLASCNQGSTSSDFSKQITELKSELLVLQIRVSALESGEATVSTEEEGYDIAKTKFGPFTVSCSGATPYLDGFKVKLRIGNLTNAKFNGAKLNICWGPRFPKLARLRKKSDERQATGDPFHNANATVEMLDLE